MMRAPTVLNVLPEGGDSRKQIMMIFTLAVIGCAVFTTYASGLFFRQKSRETGVFLALGATRAQVRGELYRELGVISLGSAPPGPPWAGRWPGCCGRCSVSAWWIRRRCAWYSTPPPTSGPWPFPPL